MCSFQKSALLIGVFAVTCQAAVGGLLAYEGFDSAPLPTLNGSAGGFGWDGAWQDVGAAAIETTLVPAGLTYPGLPTTRGSALTPASPTMTDYVDYYRPLAPYAPPNATVFIAFLMRPDVGAGTYAGLQVGTYPRQAQFGVIPGYYEYGLRVGHYGFYSSGVPAVPGQTVLLVLVVSVTQTPASTTYDLYVNPVVGEPQPAAPVASATLAGAWLPTGLDLLNDGSVTTDEIRVGTTWAAVLGGDPCLGDLDCDGIVNFHDINPFVLALQGHAAYYGVYPTCRWLNADCSADGYVDFSDIAPFVARLGAHCQ